MWARHCVGRPAVTDKQWAMILRRAIKDGMELLRLAIQHPLRTLLCIPYLVVFALGWIMLATGAVSEEIGFCLDDLSRRFSDWIIEHVP